MYLPSTLQEILQHELKNSPNYYKTVTRNIDAYDGSGTLAPVQQGSRTLTLVQQGSKTHKGDEDEPLKSKKKERRLANIDLVQPVIS